MVCGSGWRKRGAAGEVHGMLLELFAVVLVCALAFCVIAVASVRIIQRLGMDPMTVLLWLGLAEEPVACPRAQRRRLHELLVDQA